jgi:hypothetical protein
LATFIVAESAADISHVARRRTLVVDGMLADEHPRDDADGNVTMLATVGVLVILLICVSHKHRADLRND